MHETAQNPKTFVSYSWTSREHEKWVIDLATRLISDGVDIVLDKWSLREGQDKYAFMERMVTDKDVKKVVVIADRVYTEKADQKKGGVGTESQIISKEIYDRVDQQKFVPVVKEVNESGTPYLPVFLRSRIYVDMSTPDKTYQNYDQLLRAIFDKPLHQKPALGKPPDHILHSAKSESRTASRLYRLKDAIMQDKSIVPALAKEYLQALSESLADFRIEPTTSDLPLDELVYQSVDAFLPQRDEFIDFLTFVALYREDLPLYDFIFEFYQSIIKYRFRPADRTQWNDWWIDNYRFILYELFLYLIAVLVERQKFTQAALFVNQQYFLSSDIPDSSGGFTGFDVFYTKVHSFDEERNKRLGHNHISLTAAILKNRATIPLIPFGKVMQADLILYLRSILVPDSSPRFFWYPRTLMYSEYYRTFDLFKKAASRKYFDQLKLILDVSDKKDFLDKLQKAGERGHLARVFNYSFIDYETLLNLEGLDSLP